MAATTSGQERSQRLVHRVGVAGNGRLGALSIQWGLRPADPAPCAVTDRDLRMLGLLHDVNYLTASMMVLLFWGRASKAGDARIKKLHDAGLMDKFRPRLARSQGTHEWIYRLTERGWLICSENGYAADDENYTPSEISSIVSVEHDLQVSAMVVWIALRAAQHVRAPAGPLIDRTPFRWRGPRSGTYDPRYERGIDPARRSAGATLNDRMELGRGKSFPGVLKPDATLTGLSVDGEPTSILIEYDRTGKGVKQQKKLRRYDWFLNDGWRKAARFGVEECEPAVLFVCSAEQKMRTVLEAADRELSASHARRPEHPPLVPREPEGDYYPGREQVGITSIERIKAGKEEVWQVPDRPPHRRQAPHSTAPPCHPQLINFAPHRLFAA